MKYKVNRITLDIKEMMSTLAVDNQLFLANLEVFHQTAYDFSNAHYFHIRTRMPGQVVEEHKYPSNWAEAFKERWFPKYLKVKYPIKYTIVKTWHCYPEYPLPDQQRAIQFLSTEHE